MAKARRIDSNITGLAIAQEGAIGKLPTDANPITSQGVISGTDLTEASWYKLLPNSYSDFGGELTTVTPQPITPKRRRQVGAITDLDASGGFNHDLNLSTVFKGLLEGVMFGTLTSRNDSAQVVEADMSVTVTSEVPTITAPAGTFPILQPGQWVFVGGDVLATAASGKDQFATPANNGFKRIKSFTATTLVIDKSESMMVTESTATNVKIYLGNSLKDVATRRSFQLERTLGFSNTDAIVHSLEQSEVLTGAIPNEFTMNIATASILNCDFTFVASNHEQRDSDRDRSAATTARSVSQIATADAASDLANTPRKGPKQPTKAASAGSPAESAATSVSDTTTFNTSSDFTRLRMSRIGQTTPLFAFLTEMTLSVNNNVTPSKAVGVLGAFDVTTGIFSLSGSLTAYFSDIGAVRAVRNNELVSLDMALVKQTSGKLTSGGYKGLVIDIPCIVLGNGRLNVELNEPVTLPLSLDAAEIDDGSITNDDRTVVFTFFDVLPAAADGSLNITC